MQPRKVVFNGEFALFHLWGQNFVLDTLIRQGKDNKLMGRIKIILQLSLLSSENKVASSWRWMKGQRISLKVTTVTL